MAMLFRLKGPRFLAALTAECLGNNETSCDAMRALHDNVCHNECRAWWHVATQVSRPPPSSCLSPGTETAEAAQVEAATVVQRQVGGASAAIELAASHEIGCFFLFVWGRGLTRLLGLQRRISGLGSTDYPVACPGCANEYVSRVRTAAAPHCVSDVRAVSKRATRIVSALSI